MIASRAQRQFDKLPTMVKVRLLKVFQRLASWPNVAGAKALKGPHGGQFRMRAGDYRVQFTVELGSVLITKVGHREGFYDE